MDLLRELKDRTVQVGIPKALERDISKKKVQKKKNTPKSLANKTQLKKVSKKLSKESSKKKSSYKRKIILLVVCNEHYNDHLLKYLKKNNHLNTCYLTVNKGVSALRDSFKRKKIKLKNYFFIDCVTKTILEPKDEENCLFISSPKALTEISLAITKFLDISIPRLIVDNLSTLSVYHDNNKITHFIHYLSNKIRSIDEVVLILAISDKDKDTKLFQNLEMIADKVIEI